MTKILCATFLLGASLYGQQPTNATTRLPEVTVVAEKEPAPAQSVPVSVTPVTRETLKDADVHTVKDASVYAPNVFVNEFSTRSLSNPFFRGVGGGPGIPGVTTCIDGVPQFNAYSSNIELIDVDQIEFVRGPQGALFGRNTVGGLINITSRRPSNTWRTELESSYGNYNYRDIRLMLSGPISKDQLGFSFAGGYSARDGYTVNDVTGHALDGRNASFGKGQLLWTPSQDWDVRLILSGERARDGDYALGDLAYVRANPHHVTHGFEGYTHRDILAPTLLVDRRGQAVDFAMITGVVWWKTRELTDLDYTGAQDGRRQDNQQDLQFTEELRFSSAKDAPLTLSENLKLKWQAGLTFFTQDFKQDAVNYFNSGYLYHANQFFPGFPPFDSPANSQTSPQSELKDTGVGGYAQTTLTAWYKLDMSVGLRGDYEDKRADLKTFYAATDPIFGLLGAPTSLSLGKDYVSVSPQFSLAYRVVPGKTVYTSVSRGYRAGGFNPLAPAGKEAYGPESSWSYEVGAKTTWLDNRLSANLAFFYINWSNLQLNQPVGANQQYYVANAGAADSKGVELELNARPIRGWDLFAGFSYTDAKFLSGATALWNNTTVPIGGNRLIYTPEVIANAGTQYSLELCKAATLYARAEVVAYGEYQYNPANTASQSAYSLANFRLGVRGKYCFAEGWVRNAFDTHYVPIALEYGAGRLVGESGPPVTFGLRAGVNF